MKIVPGGKERQNSVFNGLKVLPSETNLVAIHDGARFLITPFKCSKTDHTSR
ncbi:unnamed protein product [marine sediment metagenome]|uniref:2-C-methyl-D-erythritol 4-phosphate cytidylyltransferase n=1 Tax=marine sediment metagenome TaxID=412755 RepID=X1KUI2_9ZZZZ